MLVGGAPLDLCLLVRAEPHGVHLLPVGPSARGACWVVVVFGQLGLTPELLGQCRSMVLAIVVSLLVHLQVGSSCGPGVDAVQVAVEVAVDDHHNDSTGGLRRPDEPSAAHPGFRVWFEDQEVCVCHGLPRHSGSTPTPSGYLSPRERM